MITKQLIVYLLACMGLLACSASSVTIEGKDGINRQKEYYLYGCQAGSLIPIASALIDSNGCFRLNVPLLKKVSIYWEQNRALCIRSI